MREIERDSGRARAMADRKWEGRERGRSTGDIELATGAGTVRAAHQAAPPAEGAAGPGGGHRQTNRQTAKD